MTLQDILHVKGTQVYTIDESATLDDVVQKLVKFNCGSLVVMGRRRGTARPHGGDRYRARYPAPAPPGAVPRRDSDHGRHDVRRGDRRAGDSIEETMQLMTERRMRHLPIVQGEDLCGLISIGDLVKSHHEQCVLENHYLKTYIQG